MNGWVRRFGLLVFYAAALSAAAWFLASKLARVEAELEQERLAALEEVQSELSVSMATAQHYVALVQRSIQNELATRPPVAPPSLLLQAVKANAEGVFSLDELPATVGKGEIGNLTGFGGLKGRDDYFRREMEIALSLRAVFAGIIESLPNAAWVYYVSASRFEHVYPWVPSSQAAYKDEDLTQEYFLRGMPENNPNRAPYQTDIYDDDFGKGLMITLGRPVYDGDRFTGIVGLDFTLGALDGILAHFPREYGELYLVDAEKTVIGYSLRSDPKDPATLPDLPLVGAALDAPPANGAPRVLRAGDRTVTAQKIQALPLTLVAIAPTSDMYAQVVPRSSLEIITFLIVVSLLAFLEWRRRAAGELLEAKTQAEEATRAKSSFLAMMSHEIRTPMNGVMSMAEMLDQTNLSEGQRSMTSVIRSSGAALLTIINDILDFSKIEAGKLDIEKTPFSLVDVVESAGELMSQRADEKKLAFATIIDPDCPTNLVGDPARVRQMLLNLIGNALKFTADGAVTVRATAAPSSTRARPVIRFAVTDTGIGLSEEQQARLFTAFAQADVSTSRKYGGTGLGLSISRRLCELMHGKIGVASEPGKGSTFWFELPFEAGADAPSALTDISDADVVLIGFHGAAREAMETILRVHGVQTAAWSGYGDDLSLPAGCAGRTAVFLSAQDGPVPALEFGRALIERHATDGDNTRFALVASRTLASTLTEAERRGFFATLTLPLRRDRVGHVIAAALGRAELAHATAARDLGAAEFTPPPIAEARGAGVLILVAEDNATNQIVIRRMLSQRGYACEIAADGREALAKYETEDGYGLLLTDFHMPEMDGFALTAEIRSREAGTGRRLPIVALTADALPGTEQRCLGAGMDGYLTKPIDSKALAGVLEKWLPGAAALRRKGGPQAHGKPRTAIDPEIFDVARLTEAFGGMSPETRAVLVRFLADARRLSKETVSAMAENNFADARDHVHSLKGACGSIGAVRLGRLAADVQSYLDEGDPETAGLFVAGLEITAEELAKAVEPLLSERV